MSTAVMWFRRDLRLRDHPALTAAAQHDTVVPLFVVDRRLLAPAGPNRVAYLRATLDELNESLGGALVIRRGDPVEVLTQLCREHASTSVFATADFAPYGRERDARVATALARHGITVSFLDSPYRVSPGQIFTNAGTPSKVFTPFRRRWDEVPSPAPLPAPAVSWASGPSDDDAFHEASSLSPAYFPEGCDHVTATLPPAGEEAAHRILRDFATRADGYDAARNVPAVEGTSRLSPHLRFGTIHPRQILAATAGLTAGRVTFAAEIAWREFYADVMWWHPTSVREELQSSMALLAVDRDAAAVERFRAWALGQTGVPFVDAGMRQLRAEGWMHNRVRMITASFLVKHLHLDWRWGARWFMWHLVDGDVASNQHGWQWTAGTGTDAAPYHRIFNPVLQASRFDPTGEYIARWVPELADVATPQRFEPGGGEGLLRPMGYPAPLIDLATERDEALARFAAVKAARA